ncbi:MAG: hypothetical protein LQ340_002982 [Diploschistes diacapsis]|nr:MAG: hypothetical protein LQ340_002982 [Diploschistes diacapsis]
MAEYGSLTVVKLKELLKERSLPVSGKKAELVARLEENDAEGEEEASANEDGVQEDAANGETEDEAKETPDDQPTGPETIEASAAEELQDAPEVGEQVEVEPEDPTGDAMDARTHAAPAGELQDSPETGKQAELAAEDVQGDAMDTRTFATPAPEPSMTETMSEEQAQAEAGSTPPAEEVVAVDDAAKEQEAVDTRPLEPIESEPIPPPQSTASPIATPIEPQQLGEPEVSASLPPPTESSIQHVKLPREANESSIEREEVVEDTRKRKRRSHSPVPDTAEVATKKAKALDGSPRVAATENLEARETAHDDEGLQKAHEREDVQDTTMTEENALQPPVTDKSDEAVPIQDDSMDVQRDRLCQEAAPDTATKEEVGARTPPVEDVKEKVISPTRQPPNAQFKGLFAATAPSQPTQTALEDYAEDREVEPALHPATTALYIRNFMRPLQPSTLQDHLESLAKSSNENAEEDMVQDFFLDTIKSHCFVRFPSISAASRVRLALHDRVWPDERARKALWVDYIPEEKIKKWIEIEHDSSGRRGTAQKRWEVVYEKENDEAVAYLQEAESVGARGSTSAAVGSRSDHVAAAAAAASPRPIPPPAPQKHSGKGFKQLDDLFRSTAAKPKLYFQPVPGSVADKRLDLLAAGRGGGRSDEMRRFTFEEGGIVDKGPEFGSGWRGGFRGGRAGLGRGHAPRGGWRGRWLEG